jgi:hypothetical protein
VPSALLYSRVLPFAMSMARVPKCALEPSSSAAETLPSDPAVAVVEIPYSGHEEADQRNEEMAQLQADLEWSEHVAQQLASSGKQTGSQHVVEGGGRDAADLVPGCQAEQLILLDFARHPAELQRSLLESPSLRGCRADLEAHGYACVLPRGAVIFVHAAQYREAMHLINGMELKRSHVLVTASLEYLVEEALAQIPSRRRPSKKTRPIGEMPSPLQVVTRRTFLGVMPRLLAASAVNQSTAAAHGSPNPRRATTLSGVHF